MATQTPTQTLLSPFNLVGLPLKNRVVMAYLSVIDGVEFNGFHELGEPMVLAEFRNVFKSAIIANGSYTQETATAAIASGNADLVAFGRFIMSNPDLVERFTNGWTLNPPPDLGVWSSSEEEGYTNFPAYFES